MQESARHHIERLAELEASLGSSDKAKEARESALCAELAATREQLELLQVTNGEEACFRAAGHNMACWKGGWGGGGTTAPRLSSRAALCYVPCPAGH